MRPRGRMGWGRILVGLIVIGVITFVGAYYVPLYRAHTTLSLEHGKVSGKVLELEKSLTETRSTASALDTKLAALQTLQNERDSGKAEDAAEVERLHSELTDRLGRHAKKGGLSVGKDGSRVVVAITDTLVFSPRKLDVSPPGRLLLCELARASGTSRFRVRALGSEDRPSPPLSQKYTTAWSLAAARAASVAEILSSKCGVKSERLLASAAPGARPSPAGSKLGSEQIEIELSAAEAPN